MGFESFRVELRGGRKTYRGASEAIRDLDHLTIDPDSIRTSGSMFFLLNDGNHVVEIELMDSPVKLSCRFTLCHPPSIDSVFLGLVRQLMSQLGMEARICDDVPPEHARSFSVNEFDDFSAAATRCIASRRLEWISFFGTELTAATTSEAHARIILPHCRGGVAKLD
jgi:hypothetical protein